MKAVQILSDEYIQKSAKLSIQERIDFLEEFILLLPESVFEEQKKKRLEEIAFLFQEEEG